MSAGAAGRMKGVVRIGMLKGAAMWINDHAGADDSLSRLARLRPEMKPIGAGTGQPKAPVVAERRLLGESPLDGNVSRPFGDATGHCTRDTRGEVSEPVN